MTDGDNSGGIDTGSQRHQTLCFTARAVSCGYGCVLVASAQVFYASKVVSSVYGSESVVIFGINHLRIDS